MFMQTERGSVAKNVLVLSLLIAGALVLYLRGSEVEERLAGDHGAGGFTAHDALVATELRGVPAQSEYALEVREGEGMTLVNAVGGSGCDTMWMNSIYQVCTMHRVQAHRDNKCRVVLTYEGGECTYPR